MAVYDGGRGWFCREIFCGKARANGYVVPTSNVCSPLDPCSGTSSSDFENRVNV